MTTEEYKSITPNVTTLRSEGLDLIAPELEKWAKVFDVPAQTLLWCGFRGVEVGHGVHLGNPTENSICYFLYHDASFSIEVYIHTGVTQYCKVAYPALIKGAWGMDLRPEPKTLYTPRQLLAGMIAQIDMVARQSTEITREIAGDFSLLKESSGL